MDGIKLLLLLVASAQVEVGTERDYGWAVNKEDGVLEYIVQINPDKKRAMEQQSVQFPNGRENVSNMPRELIGRASRVVVRFGTEVLPREPSLQDLDRTQRLFEPPNVSAAAVLGEDKFRDLESPVRNIQGQGSGPILPAMPNNLTNSLGQAEVFPDQVGQPPNLLRDSLSERLADALPSSSLPSSSLPSSNPPNSSMPGRSIPDPSTLAQNLPSQSGAGGFLDEARGGTASGGCRFSNTAPAANPPLGSSANPPLNTPTRLPDFPPTTNTNAPIQGNNPASANAANNRIPGMGNSLGASNAPAPLYPDRLNPPSLNTQPTIPQQRTPTSTFGTSPGLANNATSNWNTQTTPNSPSYSPSMSQPNDNFGAPTNYPPNYAPTANPNGFQNPTLVASNTAPYSPPYSPPNNSADPTGQSNAGGLSRNQIEAALAVREKFDKNKDGELTADEYTPASVDPILLTLFVVSLLVNLYLGHLIRKLLMRYRLVLTNVRSQAAYT